MKKVGLLFLKEVELDDEVFAIYQNLETGALVVLSGISIAAK